MTDAVREHWKYAIDNNLNFRDACFGKSIKKLHSHLEQTGLLI